MGAGFWGCTCCCGACWAAIINSISTNDNKKTTFNSILTSRCSINLAVWRTASGGFGRCRRGNGRDARRERARRWRLRFVLVGRRFVGLNRGGVVARGKVQHRQIIVVVVFVVVRVDIGQTDKTQKQKYKPSLFVSLQKYQPHFLFIFFLFCNYWRKQSRRWRLYHFFNLSEKKKFTQTSKQCIQHYNFRCKRWFCWSWNLLQCQKQQKITHSFRVFEIFEF